MTLQELSLYDNKQILLCWNCDTNTTLPINTLPNGNKLCQFAFTSQGYQRLSESLSSLLTHVLQKY